MGSIPSFPIKHQLHAPRSSQNLGLVSAGGYNLESIGPPHNKHPCDIRRLPSCTTRQSHAAFQTRTSVPATCGLSSVTLHHPSQMLIHANSQMSIIGQKPSSPSTTHSSHQLTWGLLKMDVRNSHLGKQQTPKQAKGLPQVWDLKSVRVPFGGSELQSATVYDTETLLSLQLM